MLRNSNTRHSFLPERRKTRVQVCAVVVAVSLLLSLFPLSPRLSVRGQSAAINRSYGSPERAQRTESFEREDWDLLLVGVVVGLHEVGAIEVFRSGEDFLIPLERFLEISGCSIDSLEEKKIRIRTPLGNAEVRSDELVTVDEIVYLPSEIIENTLASQVTFDAREFAVVFRFPWLVAARSEAVVSSGLRLLPEVHAPGSSLSTFSFDLRHERRDSVGFSTAYGRMGGRLVGGQWSSRVRSHVPGNISLEEYGWTQTWGSRLLLLGHQRPILHPLLGGVEMTGAQIAWTNQPLSVFSRGHNSGELLPRRLRSVSTIRGFGPPAGYAVLRVNDRPIASQVVGLNGVYEFLEVSLPSRQANQVEVFLYERHNTTVPVSIDDHSTTGSDLLLPEKAVVFNGGFGLSGNAFDYHLSEKSVYRDVPATAGFVQARYGVTRNWTVDAMIQQGAVGEQMAISATGRLSPDFEVSLGGGYSAGGLGYDFDLQGLGKRWRLTARSRMTQPGFYSWSQEPYYDHYLEGGFRLRPRLDISLIARKRIIDLQERAFILPAISWYPSKTLSLRARPDFEGQIQVDVSLQPTSGLSIGASYSSEDTFLLASQRLREGLRLTLGAELKENGNRQSATIDWYLGERFRAHLSGGLLITNGKPGFLVGTRFAPSNGLLAGFQYESDSPFHPEAFPSAVSQPHRQNRRLAFDLMGDMTLVGGSFRGAVNSAVNSEVGGLAGRIRVEPESFQKGTDLSDVVIVVDGESRTYTRDDGSFFLGGLPPGIYRVAIDPENLPIEFNPKRTSVVVEVARAAVTRVDFIVRAEFGLAGRVTEENGEALPGLTVELLNDEGVVVKSTDSDQFGLFRIDGLPVGNYTLQLSNINFTQPPSKLPRRQVKISDDFLFDQDLRLAMN